VSFTPSAAGFYAITGSYSGDVAHHTSSGQSGSVTATAGSTTPPAPSPDSVSVGHITVAGTTASVPVSCSGGSSCRITLTLSVLETLTKGKVTAVTASTKITKKTVIVASEVITVAAGKTATIKLTLDSTGKRLLASHSPLRTRLTVSAFGKRVASPTLTFKAKRARAPRRRPTQDTD
jgi:hypothetical protein